MKCYFNKCGLFFDSHLYSYNQIFDFSFDLDIILP